MKKYLIALLLSLSCTFALAAVGCVSNDPPQSGSESESDSVQEITDPVAVKFVDGEGYSFTSNAQNGVVQRGSTLTFNVELGGFYTGSPLAYVNGVAIGPNADGSYSVKVDEEVTITATGVQKDISNMAGTGAFESPFQVSKPIDLLYIAEQVNKGNRTYATGAYLLVNDIDCKGEELQVIGNNPDDPVNPAFFSGCFVSNYSDETGASYRYTISNFELNTQGTNYVGLFGAVYADLSGNKGHCPARRVEVKDTTGAGDSFCAGVAIGLTYGKSLREACEIGSHLAASVIVTSENVCPRFLPRELGLDIDVVD